MQIITALALASQLFWNHGTVTGSKINTHVESPKAETCDKTWIFLADYMDGDTPAEVAYPDYLSDLAWWDSEVDNPCFTRIEDK